MKIPSLVICVMHLLAANAQGQPVLDEPGGPPSARAPLVQLAKEFRSTEIIGGVVYNGAEERLGVINDVIIGPEGRVTAVILARGGFLGIGQRDIAVLYRSLHLKRDDGRVRFVLNTEPEILDQLPSYDTY